MCAFCHQAQFSAGVVASVRKSRRLAIPSTQPGPPVSVRSCGSLFCTTARASRTTDSTTSAAVGRLLMRPTLCPATSLVREDRASPREREALRRRWGLTLPACYSR